MNYLKMSSDFCFVTSHCRTEISTNLLLAEFFFSVNIAEGMSTPKGSCLSSSVIQVGHKRSSFVLSFVGQEQVIYAYKN